jgi:hypothetical protein
MILTPVAPADLPGLLDAFAAAVSGHALGRAAIGGIRDSLAQVAGDGLDLSQDPAHHAQAARLLATFGMALHDAPAARALTWDGRAAWRGLEPSVLIHEVGHLQVCAPERRAVPDFGLGAGPETGAEVAALANAARSVADLPGYMEEALASLQGILWEADLGQPAVLAFVEQNWLEGGTSAHNIAHFLKCLEALHGHGLIAADGRPTRALRAADDDAFLGPLVVAPQD